MITSTVKLCECGCGQPTKLMPFSRASLGWVKGQPFRFLHGHNSKGARHPSWNGGRHFNDYGYVLVHCPGHPRAHDGYVREHILVAEKALGRPLPKQAIVHHVNDIPWHNAGSNLVICEDHAYHRLLHRRADAYMATGTLHAVKCKFCKKWETNGVAYKGNAFAHAECGNAYIKKLRDAKAGRATTDAL